MRIFFCLVLSSFLISATYAQKQVSSTTLKTLSGKTINTQDIFKENQTVVIALWATWCTPCISELDAINDIYEGMQDEVDFKLIAVSIDNARTAKSVKPLVNGKGWEFDVLLDTNNDLKRNLGAITVPATYIVHNGTIVKKTSGYKPGYEEELLKYLKTL